MTRQEMIQVLKLARPELPTSYWFGFSNDELAKHVELMQMWEKQHSDEAIFA